MAVNSKQRPTPLFWHYVIQLAVRTALFAVGIWLFVVDPAQLDIVRNFGVHAGPTFVNLVFVLIALDLASKLRPRAKIAMGSRKQYAENLVPTPSMFAGGAAELRSNAQNLLRQMPEYLEQTVASTRDAAQETAQGVYEAGRQLAYSIDVLRVLPWPKDLAASELIRADIRRRRTREVVPVLIFWIVFNVAVGLLLDRFGVLNPYTVMLWTLFYFMFDMTSVVLWCPLQLMLMRNRCCTTCQIFNWDGIMTVTPLLTVWCWFSWLLILGALVVLVRWELAFARHPERFDHKTNASLRCENCTDKLCYLRKPLTPRKHPTISES